MYRMRSRIWSSKRGDFRGGVPGFMAKFLAGYLGSMFVGNLGYKPRSGKNNDHIEHGPVYRAGFAAYITLDCSGIPRLFWRLVRVAA